MSSFRFKVLLFMLPLLLPIGRVEITGEAQSDVDRTPGNQIELFEHPVIQPEPVQEVQHDLAMNP